MRPYIKVRGQWAYLYRAVDKAGATIDFFLSANRDVNGAKAFLRKARNSTRTPTKITLDAYQASHGPVREMKEAGELPSRVKVRSSQYLNNMIEQPSCGVACSENMRKRQRVIPQRCAF
jgi:putative transposase